MKGNLVSTGYLPEPAANRVSLDQLWIVVRREASSCNGRLGN